MTNDGLSRGGATNDSMQRHECNRATHLAVNEMSSLYHPPLI